MLTFTVVLLSGFLHTSLPHLNLQSRLCVNAVVASDLSRPARVHAFLVQLDAGFRLLMLKNDSLRRRYDALKYDLKRVEEVVYDLAVRSLPATAAPPASSVAGTSADSSDAAVGATATAISP